MVSGPKAFSKSDTVFGPAFGGLLRDLHRRHEVTEDVSRCQKIILFISLYNISNLLTARYIFGHFVPAMEIAQKPAEGGPQPFLGLQIRWAFHSWVI